MERMTLDDHDEVAECEGPQCRGAVAASPMAESVKREDFGMDEVINLSQENEVAKSTNPNDTLSRKSGDVSMCGGNDEGAMHRFHSAQCAGTMPSQLPMPESTPISTVSVDIKREEDDVDFFDFFQDAEVVEQSPPAIVISPNGSTENQYNCNDAAGSLQRQHIAQNNDCQSVSCHGSDESAAKAALETLLATDVKSFVSEDLKRKIIKIKELCKPKTVPCPAGYEEEVFYELPEVIQMELSKSKPSQMRKETNRWKRHRRELKRLDNHLTPGLHYRVPLPKNAAPSAAKAGEDGAVCDDDIRGRPLPGAGPVLVERRDARGAVIGNREDDPGKRDVHPAVLVALRQEHQKSASPRPFVPNRVQVRCGTDSLILKLIG